MVNLGCQATSAQSRLKKVVLHLGALRVNLLAYQVTTLSASVGKDAMIIYVDCVKEGERTKPWGRPSLIIVEGPMEMFTCTLAVRFMKQVDSHSVKQRGMTIFNNVSPNTIVRLTKVKESSNGASALG